jgi:hypothetical protein
MGRIGWIAGLVVALVVALAVGFGAGWLVFGGGGGTDDRARACASAEELPERLDAEGEGAARIELLNKVTATGLLAQSAGQDGDGANDLDDLGTAGRELIAAVNQFQFDRYPDARQALLDTCG